MAEKEYIEREAALSAQNKSMNLNEMRERLKRIPAADVRPVVKAAWKRIDYKPYGHDYECSTCGWKNDMATHFCPNCGAWMEETGG